MPAICTEGTSSSTRTRIGRKLMFDKFTNYIRKTIINRLIDKRTHFECMNIADHKEVTVYTQGVHCSSAPGTKRLE